MGFAALLSVLVCQLSAPPEAVEPTKRVWTYKLDLGRLARGPNEGFRAEVVNRGHSPDIVQGFETSCRCISLQSVPPRLPPNTPVPVDIAVDATGRRGDVRGEVVLKMRSGSIHRIAVSGRVVADGDGLVAFPQFVSIGTARAGTTTVQSLGVLRESDEATGELEVSASADWIQIAEDNRGHAKRKYFTVAVTAPERAGSISEYIIVAARGASENAVRIRVEGRIAPPIDVSPLKVLLIPGRDRYLITARGPASALAAPKLAAHEFVGTGLKCISVEEAAPLDAASRPTTIRIAKGAVEQTCRKGRLSLRYEGMIDPIVVEFIGGPEF